MRKVVALFSIIFSRRTVKYFLGWGGALAGLASVGLGEGLQFEYSASAEYQSYVLAAIAAVMLFGLAWLNRSRPRITHIPERERKVKPGRDIKVGRDALDSRLPPTTSALAVVTVSAALLAGCAGPVVTSGSGATTVVRTTPSCVVGAIGAQAVCEVATLLRSIFGGPQYVTVTRVAWLESRTVAVIPADHYGWGYWFPLVRPEIERLLRVKGARIIDIGALPVRAEKPPTAEMYAKVTVTEVGQAFQVSISIINARTRLHLGGPWTDEAIYGFSFNKNQYQEYINTEGRVRTVQALARNAALRIQ